MSTENHKYTSADEITQGAVRSWIAIQLINWVISLFKSKPKRDAS